MKNKQSGNVNYILSKNVRGSGNSIFHRRISKLMGGICKVTPSVAVLRVDGGVGCENRQMAVWL